MNMLTPKQEVFCQAVAGGKTQTDAYREGFNVRPATKPETTQNKAHKLMKKDEVRARVAELKAQLSEKLLWTREDSLKTLIAVINAPDNAGNIISSVQAINKMQGFDAAEKHELTGNLNVTITIRGR
jgi:hypothetical protein